MNRYADNDHARIGHHRLRLRPILFFENAHLIAREREHLLKQTPHLPAATDNHYRTQRRTEGFKSFVVFAGVRFPHHAAQHIFNQIWRNAQRLGLFSPGCQHGGFALRHVNR